MIEQLKLLQTVDLELAVKVTTYIQDKASKGILEMEEADVMLEILQEAVTGDIHIAAELLSEEDEYVQAIFRSYVSLSR